MSEIDYEKLAVHYRDGNILLGIRTATWMAILPFLWAPKDAPAFLGLVFLGLCITAYGLRLLSPIPVYRIGKTLGHGIAGSQVGCLLAWLPYVGYFFALYIQLSARQALTLRAV